MKKRAVLNFLKNTNKKRCAEIVGVFLGIGIVMWCTTLITPYHPAPNVNFYAAGSKVPESHYRATVIGVEGTTLKVKPIEGTFDTQEVQVSYNPSSTKKALHKGDMVLIGSDALGEKLYYADRYRLPTLVVIIAIFMALVVVVGRRRGIGSLVGLGVSVIVIGWFIVPNILTGHDALWVSIIGAYIIAFSSIIIAHGWKLRTFISIGCVAAILLIVAIAAHYTIWLLGLTGLNDETSYYLSLDKPKIDMAGVLVGGIVIASLGVLDDIVTAQVATVDELRKANSQLSVKELFFRASSVGGEHIASLVNTLALVYVGAALPIIISIASYNNDLILLTNGEYITTEVIRTIIASSGLVLAVPVSTIVAATILHRHHRPQ